MREGVGQGIFNQL